MGKIDLFLRQRLPKRNDLSFLSFAYTLAEIVIVMLIIAVIVAVTIGITKAKLDNIISYTYYNAYSSLRDVTIEMLRDWDAKDPDYKFSLLNDNLFIHTDNVIQFKDFKILKNNFTAFYRDLWTQPALAACTIDKRTGCYNCGIPTLYPGPTCSIGTLCKDGICWDCGNRSCPSDTYCPDGYIELQEGCGKICADGSVANTPRGEKCPEELCDPNKKNDCIYAGGTFDASTCTCIVEPPEVTCPDGSTVPAGSECPTCEAPSPAPCGMSWDETTCSFVGTEKTCPSGQTLNSACECVSSCPSGLNACKKCDPETGVITSNPDVNRTCSDETYDWSEDQCKCVQSARTLPRKGINFCKKYESYSNIMGNAEVCEGSTISDSTTDFSDKKADLTLRNGIRLYNMHSDPAEIPELAGNTQGGTYDGVPNTNTYGYTVYADIDGLKGDSKLWVDVYKFYITVSGKVIPAYDKSNPGLSGGDSKQHLQVSVEYEDYSTGKRQIKWLSKSVSFKDGACQGGYVGDATPYCKENTPVVKAGTCGTDGNSICSIKQICPIKFFLF